MCGICGVRRFGDTPITADQINILLVENQKRGMQATGLALQQADGSIQVWKDDEPAWRAVTDTRFKKFLYEHLLEDTVTFIGHTRAATKGHPSKNENNHPMWDGQTALVHNGVIGNDDELFKELKLERTAETDSDILRAILAKDGLTPKGINELSKVRGSAAIAAISTKYPGKIVIGRSGSPLQMAATKDQLLWSSEREPLHKALRTYQRRFGIWMREAQCEAEFFVPMYNDTMYILSDKPVVTEGDAVVEPVGDANWLEFHREFKTAYQYTPPTYKPHETYHANRVRLYGTDKPDIIQCKCGAWIPIDAGMFAKLTGLKCASCKTKLV